MAAWGGVNWPKQVKRNRTRFQVLSAHKFNYTAAVKKKQKKKLECEEVDPCIVFSVTFIQLNVLCFSSLLTRWLADICSRQPLSLLISSSSVPASPPASSSGKNGLEYIIREVGRERARRGSFSSVLTTIVGRLVSLLAGRGQQRSSGYLQPSVSRCLSVTSNPRLKWLDLSIWWGACNVCAGLQLQAGRDERPERIIRWTDLIL